MGVLSPPSTACLRKAQYLRVRLQAGIRSVSNCGPRLRLRSGVDGATQAWTLRQRTGTSDGAVRISAARASVEAPHRGDHPEGVTSNGIGASRSGKT